MAATNEAQDIELISADVPTGGRASPTASAEAPTNLTRGIVLKLLSASFSFFFAGLNDGALGALTPYMIRTWHIGTGLVAVIYAASFSGWFLAAMTNSHILSYLETGAILAIGAALQLLAHALRLWGPPYALFATTFTIGYLGCGYQDSHSNTFVTTVKGAHRWLGFIHAMYALGLLVSPFIATPIALSMPERWYVFYAVLFGLGFVNLGLVLYAFRDSLRVKQKQSSEEEPSNRSKAAARDISETLKIPGVWLLSLYFFFFLGAVITAGGWVVQYLTTTRHLPLSTVGYIPASLNTGTFLGRLILSEPTHRYGERRMLLLYIGLMLILQLVFWLVPRHMASSSNSLIVSSITICLFGFVSGPLFATGVSVGSKLFPKRVRASALGMVFVLAQAGGAVFPALTGVIATRAGIAILQPILVGLIVAMGASWALIPRVHERRDE